MARIGSVRKAAMEKAVEALLGQYMPNWREDPSTENTAHRFVNYLLEYMQPIDIDSIFHTFEVPQDHHSIVLQQGIPFRMICEHHLLPAIGSASVAYIPHERVIGLSKIARLVDAVGVEKPSLQERISDRIRDLMVEHLSPKGVMIVLEAQHMCMACRGVAKPNVNTTTSTVQGVFRDNPQARGEALALLGRS